MKNYLIYFFSMLPFAVAIGQLPISHFSGLIGYLLGIAALGAAQFIKQEIEWRAEEKIMKINSPISASISLSCLGYVLGNIRDVLSSFDKLHNGNFSLSDLGFFGMFCAILITFIVTGIYALMSKSEAKNILKEIRSRPPKPWPNANESQRSS